MSEKNHPEDGDRNGEDAIFSSASNLSQIEVSEPMHALVDLGGTLTTPGNQLLTEKFVQDVGFGISEKRQILLNRFTDWNRLSQGAGSGAENALPEIGELYGQMVKGLRPDEIRYRADSWVKNGGIKSIMPYAPSIIQLLKDSNVQPVLVSTAPQELAQSFADYLKIDELYALLLEKDESGRFTGEVEGGLAFSKIKEDICRKLIMDRRKIIFAIGNSSKDAPLFRCAIERQHPDDEKGEAILINPSPRTDKEANIWFGDYVSDGKLHIIPQRTDPNEVIRKICHVLDDVLETLKTA